MNKLKRNWVIKSEVTRMESGQHPQVDGMIEKIFMQTIEHDLSAFQTGVRDAHSTNKKLLLLHLFMQLYQDKPTNTPDGTGNQMDKVLQKVDELQQQADAFIDDFEE